LTILKIAYNIKAFIKTIEEKIMKIFEPSEIIAYKAGLKAHTKGSHNNALMFYSRAIDIQPRFFRAFVNRGIIHAKLKKYEEAFRDYRIAEGIRSNSAILLLNTGNAYSATNKYDDAFKAYNKALELDTKYAIAYYNRGLAYEYLDENMYALSDMYQAVVLSKNTYYINAYKRLHAKLACK
jgi:tetratricopeptide (TPR) repeat protein